MTTAALHLENVSIRFGGLTAVAGVRLDFAGHAITGLIGPNGAGKTTLLNAISGFVEVSEGPITFGARDLTALAPAARARLGVVRGFQTVRLLERETVFDNVLVGCERLPQPALPAQLFELPSRAAAVDGISPPPRPSCANSACCRSRGARWPSCPLPAGG